MSQLPFSLPYIQSAPSSNAHYMLAPHPQHNHLPGHVHLVSAQQTRNDIVQRKRPKYTRSKTGCLTCRLKKIKCDETKPTCQRCSHGARDCTWPDPAPPKKKAPAKKNAQRRPSTTESVSHVSDDSSGSREAPSLRAASATSSVTNTSERRYSEPQVQASPSSDILNARRQTLPSITQGQYGQGQSVHTSSMASATPEHSSNYSPHLSGTYGMNNNHNMTSAVSSRDSSRPSTANSLPPSRFPAQVMDNGHFTSSGVASNSSARAQAVYMARWEAATSRADTTAGYMHYQTQSPMPEVVRPYGHEHNSRN